MRTKDLLLTDEEEVYDWSANNSANRKPLDRADAENQSRASGIIRPQSTADVKSRDEDEARAALEDSDVRSRGAEEDESPAINGTAQHHGETASSGGSSSLPSRGTASRKPALSNKARQRIADGTNVVKREIRDFKTSDFRIDVSSLDKAIGGLRRMFNFSCEGGSSYGPIATPNGVIGFRLADHNANGNIFQTI